CRGSLHLCHISKSSLSPSRSRKNPMKERPGTTRRNIIRRREKREARGGFYYGSTRVHTGLIPLPFPFYIDK
ncbi:unnamed protein product, partial [Arabidopsis halleri]